MHAPQTATPTLRALSSLSSRPRLARLAAYAAGAALSASFAPLGLWPLAFLSPAVLTLLWHGAAPRNAAWLGFWYNAGTFSTGTYWLYISIAGFGGAPVWVALLLMAGLVAIMAAYHAALGYGIARWLPPAGALRWLVGIPAAWLLIEWVRSWLLTGFGWLAVGYSQLDTLIGAFAPVGGLYLVSLLVLTMAGALVTSLLGSRGERVVAALVLLVPWLAGWALHAVEWTQPAGRALRVAIVQGAIPQDEKWLETNLETTLDRYRDLTRTALGADVIVWPESAVPDLINNQADYMIAINREAGKAGSALVTGVIRASDDGKDYFNSVLALDREVGWYDKHHLVPFAEFFPVPAFVRRWLRLMNLPYSDFTRGARVQPPLDVAGERIAASICYEDAYGSTQLPALRSATLLVNVTNDAWFGRSTARYQHLQIAQFRALETGRYMVRAANDGVSAIIDGRGRVVARAPEFEPQVLRAGVQPLQGLTPYARVGNWAVICFAVLAVGAAFVLGWRRTGPLTRPAA